MSDIASGIEAQIRTDARVTSAPVEDRMHMLAVYGAFALIAAIVFGTFPFHPF